MRDKNDVEVGIVSDKTCDIDGSQQESESLLPTPHIQSLRSTSSTESKSPRFTGISCRQHTSGVLHFSRAFISGVLACLLAQAAICHSGCFNFKIGEPQSSKGGSATTLAPGSTTVHNFPPANPTNIFPTLFPTNVGYAGPTPTGGEPGVIATAPAYPMPMYTLQSSHQLFVPKLLKGATKEQLNLTSESAGFRQEPEFDMFRSWGNLSPRSGIGRGQFGVDSSPDVPKTCRATGLHLLHRHGARYPAGGVGPARFAIKLHNSPRVWHVTGELEFLNDWTYKLGEEVLTPFGRQQLYNLGISTRIKYGFLLHNFTEKNALPIFRTESQDRMLASALNFAIGFFGYPLEGKYQQSIMIEGFEFNNTLAPYFTCANFLDPTKGSRAQWYTSRWTANYLNNTRNRLQNQFEGFDLTIEDVYSMQELCAYETVALGYSKFCELFTEDEWKGFDYAVDLQFWYDWAFGSPIARAQGVGYVQELVARLTHTPIETHNSSTNSTLNDNAITFPLGQSLYVDATHDAVILNIITALNLTSFAASGPLPHTHILEGRAFRSAELVPFATNIQFQLLECTSLPGPQIRIIINDGVVPLTGIRGCPEQADGMCPVDTFVAAQKGIIRSTDWQYSCHGDWSVPPGPEWKTVTGDPPKPKK